MSSPISLFLLVVSVSRAEFLVVQMTTNERFLLHSLFWSTRLRSGIIAMDDRLEVANEEEGKARCGICNEPWNFVRPK